MSVALLDVNVLIALLDRRHVHHEAAHCWFAMAQADGWATCPLTQNAVLRILGQPRYPNSSPPAASVLAGCAQPGGSPRGGRLSCAGVAGGREALWLIDG
jgi:hypothetical protein